MGDELRQLTPADFPALLREIPDCPKRLFVRGALPPAHVKCLAIVGSRAMTAYGKQACRHLVEGLRGYPVAIVSGLAYGVDAEAHRAALECGIPTIAVPGSGLDWGVLYPRAHVALARQILEHGGCLLSEEEPHTRAADWTFPRRNRVMAGLSHATLIVEAKEKSGSLITAKLVSEYNRELLVVPGSIFSESSRGTHQFLKLGAAAATASADILAALGLVEREGIGSFAQLRDDLSEEERRVVTLLASPMPRDDLCCALELPITEVNVLLSTMELKGLIVEELGLVRLR